jgi:hypothetical protein
VHSQTLWESRGGYDPHLAVKQKALRPQPASLIARRQQPPYSKQNQKLAQKTKGESAMSRSRGNMSIHHLFHAEEIGVSKEANLDRLVKVFVQMSEGAAPRWIQMPKGLVVLLMVPDNPASGAIYIYDRVGQQFYFVSFDQGSDDTLTIPEFEDLLREYRLLECVSNSSLFQASVQEAARA